jgi:hypothetical protein
MAAVPEKKLGEFLLQLVMYPALLARYNNPDQRQEVLANSGLSQPKQDLLSGDLAGILNELAEEYGPAPGDHFGAAARLPGP